MAMQFVFIILSLFTMVSSTCRFVANWGYQIDGIVSYSADGVYAIDECYPGMVGGTKAGIQLNSMKFVCVANVVYANLYYDELCDGEYDVQTEVTPAQNDIHEVITQLNFDCNNAQVCTDWTQWVVSNSSLNEIYSNYGSNSSDYDFDVCTETNFSDYLFWQFQFTNVCAKIDLSVLNFTKKSEVWTCNETGIYNYIFEDSWFCDNEPAKIYYFPINGCLDWIGDGSLQLYGKMTYCNGVEYNVLQNPNEQLSTTSALMETSAATATTLDNTGINAAYSDQLNLICIVMIVAVFVCNQYM